MKHRSVMHRTFRDPTPPLPMRKAGRRSQESPRPAKGRPTSLQFPPSGSDEGPRPLKLETLEKPPQPEGSSCRNEGDTAGRILGGIAVGFVVQLWLMVAMWLLSPLVGWGSEFWSDGINRSFVIAFYGVHLFGVAGGILSRGERSWGVMAIAAFWFSVLLMVPVGALLSAWG